MKNKTVTPIAVYCILYMFLLGCANKQNTTPIKNSYPTISERKVAKAHTSFYIDPNIGDDSNSGITKENPWKTFKRVNQLQLTEGNIVEILSAGDFKESLFLTGKGREENPITIKFAPGTYNFYPENAYKSQFHISNTNDAPKAKKAVAFYFLEAEHVRLNGNGAKIMFRGKVMETGIRYSKNISVENLTFDYHRPTVSEFMVVKKTDHFADIQVHPDSKYKIIDSTLVWIGEGWEHKAQSLWQAFNPKTDRVARTSISVENMRFTETGNHKLQIHFQKKSGLQEGVTYQNRDTFRDYAAIFSEQSSNILWKNVTVHFMHGMGFVSQFCENITFDNLSVKPNENSGRTCAAWADILHFSSCKGNIEIKNSYLSAANDDAVNVHGTHLRIVETLSDKKLKVRFIHPQTFGFEAFHAGDSIEFIRNTSLLPYSKNKVVTAKMINEKEMELVLEQAVPDNIQPKDVLENITWTPNVTITNTKIVHIPTRGVLITTRGKVLIENNTFFKPTMSGVLIADDANGWFESGYVKDVTIRNNKFIDCGAPVINIHPENQEIVSDTFVHKNIRILDNVFKTENKNILSAKSTQGIQFLNNTIEAKVNLKIKDMLHFKACEDVEIKENIISVRRK